MNKFRLRKSRRNHENGNVFLMLFAGVAMVGLLGAAAMNFMQGPLKTATSITRNNAAQTQMLAASKLVAASALTSPTGDCDSDGLREPPEWKVATGAAGTFPAGGGHLPDTLGASKTDPWGTPYGYCGWDHGTQINDSACGGSVQKRLGGGTAATGIVISMISAGPDKIFQTTCAADPNYVTKPTTSDDVVMNYTVAEMGTLAGGTGGGGTTTTPADCTGMGEAFYNDATTGHCYYRSTGMKNWDNAQADCQASGGYLAVISSSAEQAILKNNFTPVNGYIGARSDGSYPLAWRWKGGALSGVEFWRGGSTPSGGTSVDGRYNNWSPGGPTYNSGYDCVMMSNNSNMNWTISQCNPQNPYYCEKEGVTLATGGSDNLGDHAATQTLNMNGYTITGAGVPILLTDVANKAYVDSVAASGGGGGSAAPFSFQTKTNIIYDTKQRSNIVQVTGITGEATAVISGDGKPSFRICSDANCNTVTSDWTTASQKIINNDYVQLQTFATYTNSLQITVGLTIGSTTGNWRIIANPSVNSFTIPSTTNATHNTQIQAISTAIVPQGVKSLTFSISGEGSPRYSVLAGSWNGTTCGYAGNFWAAGGSSGYSSAVTVDTTVSAGYTCYTAYVYTTPPTPNATAKVTFSVNEASADWTITTAKIGYLVLTNGKWNGNLGGLSGANDKCLSDLNANDWKGKAAAVAQAGGSLTSSNVKAYLCDSTTCNNPVSTPTTNYVFARSGSPTVGGGTTIGYSTGRLRINAHWFDNNYLGTATSSNSTTYWTNRSPIGGEPYDANTTPMYSAVQYNCSGFTSNSSSYYGITGRPAQYIDENNYDPTDVNIAYGGLYCQNAQRLLCMVLPPP